MKVPFVLVFVLLCISVQATTKEKRGMGCSLCKTMLASVRSQLNGQITEAAVTRFIKSTCDGLFITSWCTENIYPYFDEVFRSLKDNRTDSIACGRLNLCQSKIVSVTGDIMFAEGDRLSRIVPVGDDRVQRIELWQISHPYIPTMKICGFACSPDYCAVLLSGTDTSGKLRYGSTALSIYSQRHHLLDAVGTWYGPWYDAHTDEFWLAYGTPANFTFGLFDAAEGVFRPRINTRLYIPGQSSPILAGSVLNRLLYFTVKDDPHVFVLDLALHVFLGNLTMSTSNIMLANNPVTQILYGYTPGPEGVFRFDTPTSHTKIASIDFTGIALVPSSTIDPTDNTMWISLWGLRSRAWMKIDLSKLSDNVRWTQTGSLEGYFDFNPYKIDRIDV